MPIKATPVVVPPSGYFDGNDGLWSSFIIAVGTPPQSFRVLVSTKLSDLWVISQSQSQDDYLAINSPAHRTVGGGLSSSKSTTWQGTIWYEKGQDQNFGKSMAKFEIDDYGSDPTRIGLAGIGNINVDSRTIATVRKGYINLGLWGINHRSSHLSPPRNGQVSFLESLKASGCIPSLSYAYSAGAWYRNRTLGTLILGGYDNARIMPDQLSLPMSEDVNRDLVVVLESISFSDSAGSVKTLHSTPFQVFIDSTVPYLWLPPELCSKFEDAFGLSFNSSIDRYLVNDTHHKVLQQQNANVTFHLGNDESGETIINITLPYASFDLELGFPFVNTKQYYFPIRRAANATQYSLGRTFLQEAYLIVDHERSNFSISQTRWSENVTPQILPLPSMTDKATAKSTQRPFTNYNYISSSLVMDAGLITGIVSVTGTGIISFALPACIIVAFVTYSYRRYRRQCATLRSFKDKKLGHVPETADVNNHIRGFSIRKAPRLVISHLTVSKGKSEMNISEGPNALSRPSLKGRSLFSRLRIYWSNRKEYTYINKLKLYVESWSGEAWDWWPLCPSFEQPEEADFSQSQQNSEQNRANSAITKGLPFRATSKGNTIHRSENDDVSNKGVYPSAPITVVDVVPPSSFTGFVLFGVHGSQRLQSAYLRLAQIEVSDKDDDEFFDQMIVEFRRLRGFLRRTFSIWVFHTCEFIMFHKANPNEIMPGPQEMPPSQDPDYYYTTNRLFPPVLGSVFHANFYGCTKACVTSHLDVLRLFHQCKGRNHCGRSQVLDRLPKRVRRWEIDLNDETDEAWGLNAVFAVSFYRVVSYHVLILAGSVVFWGLWLKKWPTDWQNASVPFFAVVVLLSLFWLPFAHNSKPHANRNFVRYEGTVRRPSMYNSPR